MIRFVLHHGVQLPGTSPCIQLFFQTVSIDSGLRTVRASTVSRMRPVNPGQSSSSRQPATLTASASSAPVSEAKRSLW